MAAWTTTGRTSVLAGAVRTFLPALSQWAQGKAAVGQFSGCEQGLRAMIFSDTLGLNGYEVGFDVTGTGGQVFVRPVDMGVPDAATVDELHGLTTGTPGTIDIRVVDLELQVRLNGAETPVLTHTFSPTDPLLANMHWGWVSDVDGCTVSGPKLCALESIIAERAEVLIPVCGGNVFRCLDGSSIKQVASGVFKASGSVGLRGYHQKMYGVDGEHAVEIDPIAETAVPWTLTAGTHLGGDNAGKTRAVFLFTHGDRIGQGGDPQDPQNLLFFVVGNAKSADTGAAAGRGRAWLLSGAAGKVGSAVTGCIQMPSGALSIGCVDSVWVLTGDLALGNVDLSPRAQQSVGLSGPEAMCIGPEGRLIAHGPEGLYVQYEGGAPVPLSSRWLTKVIQFARDLIPAYNVQVRYDSAHHRVHVFLTLRSAPGGYCRHFIYDVRVGGFEPDAGGFFEVRWPDELSPTASAVWQGKVIWGTRSGMIVTPDDDATSDLGAPIEVRAVLSLVKAGDLRCDTILGTVAVQTGMDSGPVDVAVYGGRTAEDAYARHEEELRWADTLDAPGGQCRRGARAPALVIELSQTSATDTLALEAVDVTVTTGRMITPSRRSLPDAPATPCGPPAAASDAPTSGEGPGPGGDPDPDTCTACADWMDVHTTGDVGGEPAFLLAGPLTFAGLQAALPAAVKALLEQNVCDVDPDVTVYLTQMVGHGTPADGEQLLSEFMALDPDDYPPADNATWRAYFRCVDQPGLGEA